jgi:hypothetical protein
MSSSSRVAGSTPHGRRVERDDLAAPHGRVRGRAGARRGDESGEVSGEEEGDWEVERGGGRRGVRGGGEEDYGVEGEVGAMPRNTPRGGRWIWREDEEMEEEEEVEEEEVVVVVVVGVIGLGM